MFTQNYVICLAYAALMAPVQDPPSLEDVATPRPCEPAWIEAFHILEAHFLLLNKSFLWLSISSLKACNDCCGEKSSRSMEQTYGHGQEYIYIWMVGCS